MKTKTIITKKQSFQVLKISTKKAIKLTNLVPFLLLILIVFANIRSTVTAELLDVEKDELIFGFIKLTDCAPLVIAKEKLFFEDEGLEVRLEAQANWKILLDRVISGELDGAHMLAGQPIGATIGFGTQAHIITPYSLDYNGNGITVSNDLWEQMQANDPALQTPRPKHPITADSLKPIVDEEKAAGNPIRMGMVFPVSTHNYEIRYWLAAAGIRPGYYVDLASGAVDATGTTDADVLLSVTPLKCQQPWRLKQLRVIALENHGISRRSYWDRCSRDNEL